ncbi:MAG: beta-propeller fold lactonase family protein [Bacteroidetes bacterium]|nr:beta-propeller fold lactonase family protein [Bacteroidota bacterium]
MTTNTLVETVALTDYGFSENAKPHHVAVEPDGSAWYVSLIGDDAVAKFSRAHELLGTAAIETPGMLAVHPTRDLLVAGRSMSAVNPPSSLGLIRRSDMTVTEVPVVFPRPHALTVDPAGAYVHTASLAENRVMTVDLDTEDVTVTRLDGPTEVFVQFAAVPDRAELLVSGQLTRQMTVFDVSDPAAPSPVATIPVGRQPWHPVVTPDGARLYVGNKEDDSVSVIDVAAREVVATITGVGLAEPHGSAVRPDGRYVYISNNNQDGTYTPQGDNPEAGTVVVIDTETNAIAKVLEVGTNPTGIGARQP